MNRKRYGNEPTGSHVDENWIGRLGGRLLGTLQLAGNAGEKEGAR
jgi:hypothetical protein